MKKILLFPLFLFVSLVPTLAQLSPLSATDIMNDAFSVAKKEEKKVFVMFHASWCSWCHKMDRSMDDISVKKYFDDNFVIRHLVVFESKGKKDLENPGALEMLTKYNGKDQGIPYWIIFDKEERFIADSRMPAMVNGVEKMQNTGCPATKEEVDYFIKTLKKATSLKDDDLEIIRTTFRKNETN